VSIAPLVECSTDIVSSSININASYCLTEWMGLGFSYIEGSAGGLKWRLFIGLQLLCAAIMLAGSIWMPESPRWLVVQKRHDEALAVLSKLHGTQVHENEDTEGMPFYRREYEQIEAQIRLEQETPRFGLISILKRPSYRKRLFIILFFFCFQQLTVSQPETRQAKSTTILTRCRQSSHYRTTKSSFTGL